MGGWNSYFSLRNIDRDVQVPPSTLIHALLGFWVGKYGLSEANMTLIRPTQRKKGHIGPLNVNTTHSISSGQGRKRIWVLIFQHLKLGPICALTSRNTQNASFLWAKPTVMCILLSAAPNLPRSHLALSLSRAGHLARRIRLRPSWTLSFLKKKEMIKMSLFWTEYILDNLKWLFRHIYIENGQIVCLLFLF